MRDMRPRAALAAVRKGIEQIEDFYNRLGQEQLIAASGELNILRGMAKEIEGRIPVDPIEKLRRKLATAVREERYEEAAQLRDRIRHISDHGPTPPE